MKTETLLRIRALNEAASTVGGFHAKMDELRSDQSNDKLGAGFCLDNRFEAFSFTINFSSWCGRYGSSSCHNVLNLDSNLAREMFVKAMNKHQKLLFETAAEFMREEARSLTDKAQAEVTALQTMLDNLTAPAPQSEAA